MKTRRRSMEDEFEYENREKKIRKNVLKNDFLTFNVTL